MTPPAESCLMSWFAGGSVGYLTQLEEPMYNIHVGFTNSCWNLLGAKISLFGEVGYTQSDDSGSFTGTVFNPPINPTLTLVSWDSDVTVVPITFNVKFDWPITSNFNAYLGGGIGVAWMDASYSASSVFESVSVSDSKWIFTAQIFAGLDYDITPNFQIYGGARWVYFDNPDFVGQSVMKSNDCLLELGGRFKF